jgi:hypothetical protein
MTSNFSSFRRVVYVALFLATVTHAFRAPENPVTNIKVPSTLLTKPPVPQAVEPTPTKDGDNTVAACTAVPAVDARALTEVGRAVAQSRDARFYATSRKRWGIDHAESGEYWFDSRIHTFGNIGFWGAVHAAMAPLSTKLIDMIAYDGEDVRAKVC